MVDMDTYKGPAVLLDGDQQLGSVHVDVTWQGHRWWGVMTSQMDLVAFVGHSLTLSIEDHPKATLAFVSMGTRSDSGQLVSRFDGSGIPPFWSARPVDDLVAELQRRRPSAASLTEGVEPPTYVIPDELGEKLREILRVRDGFTDDAIEKLIWA